MGTYPRDGKRYNIHPVQLRDNCNAIKEEFAKCTRDIEWHMRTENEHRFADTIMSFQRYLLFQIMDIQAGRKKWTDTLGPDFLKSFLWGVEGHYQQTIIAALSKATIEFRSRGVVERRGSFLTAIEKFGTWMDAELEMFQEMNDSGYESAEDIRCW